MHKLAPLTLIFVCLCITPSVFAQGDTGQLNGTVVYMKGDAVPGASVKLTSLTTSQVREATTGDAGNFGFTILPPGRYKVEVSAAAFRDALVETVHVYITQTTTILVQLELPIITGTVTVDAETSLVQLESSQVGRVIEGQTLRQLPLPTRNFQQLLTLSPGTSASVSNNTDLGRGDSIVTVNGQRTTLQLSLTKRFGDGLQFLAAYTLSKSQDYYSGGPVNELVPLPGDHQNWKLNYGPSDYDRRHRFIASFVFDLPEVATKNRLARTVLNNWQVNGIVTFQTGTPFSIVDAPNNFIIQRANFATNTGQILTSGSVESRLNEFFNSSSFVLSRPILGGQSVGVPDNPAFDPDNPFGNTPRNFLYGPGQKNVDLAVVRFLDVTERVRGEVRGEFFNVFNWTNFANPNNNIAVPATFGRITATSSGPRVIQLAFKVSF